MRRVQVEDLAAVPVPVGTLARALERHDDYRVLRRIKRMERREPGAARAGELSVCVLDVETTGLDVLNDRIIELSLQTVRIDQHGRIVFTGRNNSWLEDPGLPISTEVTRVTGISEADVKGRAISDGEAYGEVFNADVLLSHNAGFDRPFVDRRLELEPKPWICSLRDLDWRAHGFEGRSLTQLLLQCGWFFEAHRAAGDVNALLHLLDHRLDEGGTVMKALLATAAKPTWVVDAVGAPFSAKDVLKARGYKWDVARKLWSLEVGDDARQCEGAWLSDNLYGGLREPIMRPVTWRERYSAVHRG